MRVSQIDVSPHVVLVVANLGAKAGGPSRTVVQLADELARGRNLQITLLSQGSTDEPSVKSKCAEVDRRVYTNHGPWALLAGLPIRRALMQMADRIQPLIIHNNGLWLPVNCWAGQAARRYKVPLLVHPHGMLEPWAVNHKAGKKRIAMMLFQRRDLEMASVIVGTCVDEYQSIRRLGFRSPVAIIPNGVELDVSSRYQRRTDETRSIRTALFLSRVHPVKGLINLVRAWGALRPMQWRLLIAGPDEGGHLDEIMAEARRLGVADVIEYVGEVDGAEKASLYRASDLFVLPTLSENFGVVVAEALTHSLPVITTRGAPWADLATYRCGWWIDIGVDPLTDALRQAIALSDDDRRAMGERGRVYVRRYNWADIAKQTTQVYRWVLGQEPRPDCVHLD